MAVGFQMRCTGIGLAVWLLAACSKPADDATLSAPAITLNFATGRPLTPVRMAEMFPEYELTDPEVVPAPLIFGSGRVESIDLREPVILRRSGNAWTFVELPMLNHTAWVYAGAAYERDELWAILDSTPESKGAGLYLFRSVDHGGTWNLFSGVRPPTLSAEFVEFALNAKGIGHITVHQDDDTDATPRGSYTYATADGGKTWHGPTFLRDDLISADTPLNPMLEQVIEELDPNSVPQNGRGNFGGRSNYAPPGIRGGVRGGVRGRGG